MTKNKNEVLKARNLSVHFNRNGQLFKAVDKVDFTVLEGEILALVGESGSGKTTLGKALMGLWSHATGGVRIDGKKIPNKKIRYVTKKNRWIYEKSQIIYQDPTSSLNEVKKVSEILSEGVKNFKILEKERDQKVEKLEKKLEKVKKNLQYAVHPEDRITDEIQANVSEYLKNLKIKLIKQERRLSELINISDKIATIGQEINFEKRKLYWFKKIGERDIKILKKEKFSNTLMFKDIEKSDGFELHSAKTDEKEEMVSGKVKDPKKTRAFKTASKIVSKVIATNINDAQTKIEDITFLIKKLKENAKKEKNNGLQKLIYTKTFHLEEEREYLRDIKKIYDDLKSKNTKLIKEHTSDNINEYYNYLIKQNKLMFSVHSSLNSWKLKMKISRLEKIIFIKSELIKQKIKKLKINRDVLVRKLFPKEYHERLSKVEGLVREQAQKIKNQAKLDIADKIKELSEQRESTKKIKEEIVKIEHKIKLMKKSLKGSNKGNILDEKLYQILEKVGLSASDLDKYPSQFSGGQKQRIGIARSILTNPRLIIADEPISALDVSLQAGVVNLLRDLQKEYKMSIVFIAHDLEMVNYLADRIAVIYKGKVVEMGPAESVYKKPIHPYTKELINAQPSIKKIGAKLKTSEYDISSHNYNEYKVIKEHEVRKGHYVLGTLEEIKEWK